MIDQKELEQFIQLALYEDVRGGDYSSLAILDKNTQGKARLLVKDEGVLCGMPAARKIFEMVDADLRVEEYIAEGNNIHYGDVAFHVYGSAISILTAERLVLNCMQRMSGIATKTQEYVKKIAGTSAKVIDTRKTTPGIRFLEKYAVTVGGGANHRMGLYDMIMLKDNHIDYCGGIEKAIEKAWRYVQENKPELKIEVETRSIADVEKVLAVGRNKVTRVMLDNFNPADVAHAVSLIGEIFETEASGGINLQNIEDYAKAGVDYVSVGALIHQAKSLDLSLKAVIVK